MTLIKKEYQGQDATTLDLYQTGDEEIYKIYETKIKNR